MRTRQEDHNMEMFNGMADRINTVKLTKEQLNEVKLEMVMVGPPVRFLHNGCCINIVSGDKMKKGVNVIHQHVYWNFKKETSLKIAKWLGVKAVFSE